MSSITNCPRFESLACEISKKGKDGLNSELNWQRTISKMQVSLPDVFFQM